MDASTCEHNTVLFSHLLGWKKIKRHTHIADNPSHSLSWFSEGEIERVYFQINVSPFVHVAVYAMPDGVFTGWHKVNILTPEFEASRLSEMLSKRNFSRKSIPAFKKRFTQFTGFFWKEGGGIANDGNSNDYSSWFPSEGGCDKIELRKWIK